MPFLVLSVLLQVAFIIHIVKTGRKTTWIWIVLMLPMAGSLAYLILEVLPDFTNTYSGRQASKKVKSVLNPNDEIRAASKQFAIVDSVDNSRRLAEECLSKELFSEAKELYEKCLTGMYSTDPYIMHGLAKAEYELGSYTKVKSILDELIEVNPDYKDAQAHLLYARTLEKLNDVDSARHEYEALYGYFTGPEAMFHYAHFLKVQGEIEASKKIFQEIIEKANLSERHYKTIHKQWIKQAKVELKS